MAYLSIKEVSKPFLHPALAGTVQTRLLCLSRAEAACAQAWLRQAGPRSGWGQWLSAALRCSRVPLESCRRQPPGGAKTPLGTSGKPTWAGRGWKGTFGCSQVQKGTRTWGLQLLGHSSLYCTRFASSGKKNGCDVHPINIAMAQRGPSKSVYHTGHGAGEFLSPWGRDKEDPQSRRCS